MTTKNLQNLKQSQKAKGMNLAAWWANQFIELDMPSGLHVIVRDVDMEDLVVSGHMPNSLMNVFQELEGMDNQSAGTKLMEEHPESFKKLLDALVLAALVEPKIGERTDPDAGTISINDFRGKDKLFIFNWLNREAGSAEMRSFRAGENKPVANS